MSRSVSPSAFLPAYGRDKLTLVASPSIADFGAWAEQLIAESTGKNGKGVIPIDAEPLGEPGGYDAHRLFVYLRDGAHPDAAQDAAAAALERAGQPLVRIDLASAEFLAQEFFRFEIATAVAGAVIGINPFDQPNVEASKVAMRAMTDAFEQTGSLPAATPVFEENGIALYTDARNAQALRQGGADSTLASWLQAHFARLQDGDYFAILAYLASDQARLASLQNLRDAVRDRKARRHLPAIRSAVFALDRAGLQRRTELRRVFADHGGAGRRPRHSRPQGKLRRDRGGAGARRFPRFRRTRPARVARAHLGCGSRLCRAWARRRGVALERVIRYCETNWRSRA